MLRYKYNINTSCVNSNIEMDLETWCKNVGIEVVRIKLKQVNDKKIPIIGAGWEKKPAYSRGDAVKKNEALWVFSPKNYKNHDKNRESINDYTHLAINTKNIFQLDFDEGVDTEVIDKLKKLNIPYFLSCKKRLPHFIINDKSLSDKLKGKSCLDFRSINHHKLSSKNNTGELLCGQWSYALPNEKIFNVNDNKILTIDIMATQTIVLHTLNKPKLNKNDNNIIENTSFKQDLSISNNLDITNVDLSADYEREKKKIMDFSKCLQKEVCLNKGTYKEWSKNIVWALNDYPNEAKIISKLGDCYEEDIFNKTREKFDPEKGVTIASFYEACKQQNLRLYYKLKQKWSINPDFCYVETEYDVADIVYKFLGKTWLYQGSGDKKSLYFWSESQKKWYIDSKNEYTFGYIKVNCSLWIDNQEEEYHKIWEKIKFNTESPQYEKIRKKICKLQHIYKQIKTETFLRKTITCLIANLASRHDNREFDNQSHLFAFKNKVYNFRENKWCLPCKENYILQNTEFDYIEPTPEQMDIIKILFLFGFWENKETEKCYVSALRSGFWGQSNEKFVIAEGAGRNMKGLANDLIKSLFNDGDLGYCYKGNIEDLCKGISSGASPSVAHLNNKRLTFFTEADKKRPLNVATIKEITGGGTINSRLCNSNETKQKVICSTFMETNGDVPMSASTEDDTAIVERVIKCEFLSRFIAKSPDKINVSEKIFMPDPNFKDNQFQQSLRCALFKFLINYHLDHPEIPQIYENKVYVPECIQEKIREYICKGDKFYRFLKDRIEKIDNFKFPEEKELAKNVKLKKYWSINHIEEPFEKNDEDKYTGLGMIPAKKLLAEFKESDVFSTLTFTQKRECTTEAFCEYLNRSSRYGSFYKQKLDVYKTITNGEPDPSCKRNCLFGWRLLTEEEMDSKCIIDTDDLDEA